jgi:hypothetical protein
MEHEFKKKRFYSINTDRYYWHLHISLWAKLPFLGSVGSCAAFDQEAARAAVFF